MKIIIVLLFPLVICFQLIPEKADVTWTNDKYIINSSLSVTQLANGRYVFNMAGITKHTWGNNVTINLVIYEYVHNEYRRSFMEFHFKLCELINFDPYVGAMLTKTGITCPLRPGLHLLKNMNLPTGGDVKYLFVLKKSMVTIEICILNGECMGKGRIFVYVNTKKAKT